MAKEERSVLEQLEDALLNVGPAACGVVGGIIGAGLLKDKAPAIVGFVVGGAIGGGLLYAVLAGLFRLVNLNRDRN